MSLKRTDLAKKLNLKIQGQMQHAAVPSRFAQAAAAPDRREQRKLDQAAGLVPFAVKLNKELVARLGELAAARQVTLHALVDEALRAGLAQLAGLPPEPSVPTSPAAQAVPAAKKAPAKKAPIQKAPADQNPAKKAPAKKAATKTVSKTAR